MTTRIDDDKRWQRGHVDGEEKLTPTSDSYAYVSGWIAGYCECEQCSGEEAEHAYLRIVQQEKK